MSGEEAMPARRVEISPQVEGITLINVFTVVPEKQDHLVGMLVRATDEFMRHQPGFVSASIHKSIDGTRVTNYAQWRSQADFDTMLKNEAARAHMNQAAAVAVKFEPVLYTVASVHAA
jgi:quinol monooxygenase YgiN